MARSDTRLGEFPIMMRGEPRKTDETYEVLSPYDQSLVAVVHRARAADIEEAIQAAEVAFQETRHMPSWRREQILEQIADGITARRDEIAQTIALEAGKPVTTAGVEVDRAAFVFRVAAEEAKRIEGSIVSLDWLPGNEGRRAEIYRVPLGVISGISPFNFPLNLVAHKVAPAIAVGNPILLRPASQTPLAALKLAEIVYEAGLPKDAFAVLPSSTATAAPLVEDDRIKKLTFTGSPQVGWALKAKAGRKRVTLELGGNAAVIVCADADVSYAAERVAWGGFSNAGQSCISVQRVYVDRSVYPRFVAELVERVGALKAGDPLDPATDVGPMIDGGNADRVESWLKEAQEAGAEILTGGVREGNVWRPTVLASVEEYLKVSCEEVFAPLLSVSAFDDVNDAITAAGTSDFGLQGGIFTNDMRIVERAFDQIEVGGLMVNDVSTYRIDHMPYGGVKQSGTGREGLRYAMEEMTEMKLLTFNSRS
ncbi:MAG: aldehyde dehydrogenase family protein [Solirubrobacteraceae bacterium]